MKKIAIIGAGAVANLMANTIKEMVGIQLYSITDNNLEVAEEYAKAHGINKVYKTKEEMLKDPNIDLVYIAVPHVFHYECIKLCLNAGKNVLCEKPFCINSSQTQEVIGLAKEKELFLAEAIWTRYMPSRKIIDELIKSNKIGEIKSMTANIGYNLTEVSRIWNPKLGGGALLDVGIYLIHFARMIFGETEAKINSSALFKDGVDMIDNIIITYLDGKVATFQAGVNAVYNRNATIFGTNGYIEITNINNPELIKVFNENHKEIELIKVPKQITGYEYEIEASLKAITMNKIECSEIPHKETLEVMKIIDGILDEWGYKIQ
ncbi:MAG: Gfo/Idh/MocA family protein [Fusobacteriaceae bacterium]